MIELQGRLVGGVTTKTFLAFAQDLFAALGAPLAEVRAVHTVEEHPGKRPETIETRTWTEGPRRVAVILASDPPVAMESTDRESYAEIDGLPGGVELRARGDDFGRLSWFRIRGLEPDLTHVADAWLAVVAARTGSTWQWHDDPTIPREWAQRVYALPRLSSTIVFVDITRWGRTERVPWAVHEADDGQWGIADTGPHGSIPRELEVIGPLPKALDLHRVTGGGPSSFDDGRSWIDLFAAWTRDGVTPQVELEQDSDGEFSLRMRAGARVLRASGTRGGSATAYLQSELGDLPLVRFDRTHGGRKDGGASFALVLLGDRSAFPGLVESLRAWTDALGFVTSRVPAWARGV